MPAFNPEETSNWFLILVLYGGVILAAFWLAMILWTYRDMRARSRDRLAQLLVAVMVAVLTFPGLLIYILLRPRETLSEAYERSLEEEALLQEIEEKPSCPGCGQRTQANWQVCPNCHTKLKKPCPACGKTLELAWNICPYCATPQVAVGVGMSQDFGMLNDLNPVITTSPPRVRGGETVLTVIHHNHRLHPSSAASSSSLEFIDGEEY